MSDDIRKELGKISHVSLGLGGYQDAMLGLHFTFTGQGWGISTTYSTWDPNMIPRSEHAKWTEEDRSKSFDEIMRKISDLLKEAKVDSIDKLKGIPVEVSTKNGGFHDFRILTEVL